jgi:hypothetical protein
MVVLAMDADTDRENPVPAGVTEREWRRVLRAGDALRIILSELDGSTAKDLVVGRTLVSVMGFGLDIGMSATGRVDFHDVLVDYCAAAGIWPQEGV